MRNVIRGQLCAALGNMINSVIRICFLLIYLLLHNEAKSYHAVVIIHGVLTGSDSMELISNRIQEVGRMTAKQKEHHNIIILLCKADWFRYIIFIFFYKNYILFCFPYR